MTAATGNVFLDTNVLVYAYDASEPEKQPIAQSWYRHLWISRRGRTSVQVLNEYYHTVTHKLKPGRSPASARSDIRALEAWRPFTVQVTTVERAWMLQDRYGLPYWDALIVAAAEIGRCEYLLTEDLQDGQELNGLRVVNPFLHEPESLP